MKKWQFFILLSILNYCNASKLNITSKDIEIEKALSRLNKTPVTSIQSPDGDIIDCVDIYKQPAFDNPLMNNHTIMKIPSYHPLKNFSSQRTLFNFTSHNTKPIPQLWHLNGRCPDGTIPIRRTKKEDLLRAANISRYGMKDPNSIPGNENPEYHEYATVLTRANKIYGAWGTLNVWRPQVDEDDEFSLSQMWLVRGSRNNRNSVEAGWMVHPTLYGDRNTRLFTYWTRDGYQNTGCYNLICQGFVQTNHDVSLNAVIDPVSVYGSTDSQIEISVLIWKDAGSGNWYLEFDNVMFGYWPGNLFTSLRRASLAEWGGEVINKREGGLHTSTHMGSGHFSREMYGGASYVKNILILDETNILGRVPPGYLRTYNPQPNCYDVQIGDSDTYQDWGDYFFFGGPGYSPQCR